MGSAAPDPTLQVIFETEVSEVVEALQDHLLQLEQGCADRAQRLADMLRLAHDIKGSARVVGAAEVARIAHALEARLLMWRDRPSEGTPGVQLALDACDLLGPLAAAAQTSDAAVDGSRSARRERAGALVAALDPGDGSAPAAPRPAPEVHAPVRAGEQARATAPSVRPVPEGQRAPAAGAAGPAGTLRVDLRRIDAALERSTDALTQVKLLQQRYEELRHELASLRNVRLPRPDDAPRALARITAGILASTSAMGAVVRELGTVVHDFSTDIDSLDDAVHGLRLVPCAGLVGHLERVARDAASALGRKALLVVDGGGLDIDKALLDALKGPLTHAVRNAVDHGIEPTDERAAAGKPAVGELRLILREERKALHVLFSDDGRGIDRAAVRERLGADAATLDDKALLARLLRAGRSTRDTVSEISGRGIGLGALASLADELHGDVTLTSQPGRGTSVVLKLPLRLSQVDVRTVESGGLVLMLPQSGMCRVDRATDEQRVPALGALLGCPDGAPVAHVVTLQGRDRRARFGVSHLGKREQVVQQPVGAHLGKLPFVSGVTLAADGDPAWILDPRALVDSGAGAADLDLAPGAAVRRILLVDDNPAVRKRLHDDLTRAGHDVVLAFDGLTALDRLEAMRFDAVVSDVQMPRLDGFGLLERCGGRLPVVLMSSLDDAATTRRARDLGAVAFLVKAADLGSRVEAVLADIFSRNLEASP